jgi:hypothetical protein
MNKYDKEIFAMHLGVCAEVFNEPITAVRIAAYFEALEDMDVGDVVGALKYAMRESKFFPRPADIRGFVNGTPDELADAAWAKADEHGGILKQLGLSQFDFRMLERGQRVRMREPFRALYKRQLANAALDAQRKALGVTAPKAIGSPTE